MSCLKILNLYAGLGGNRLLWGTEHKVTAIENNKEIARLYKKRFPQDTVIVADAREYLLKHLMDGWDFIWASPPCLTHSKINTDGNRPPMYPDMSLYEIIIMLSNNWYRGKWVVENVVPYYKPLIKPSNKIGRHLFWCNFVVGNAVLLKAEKVSITMQSGNNRYGFVLKGVKMEGNKRRILRNLVDPMIGKTILEQAFKERQTLLTL